MFPATNERVSLNTDEQINRQIRRQIEFNVMHYSHAGPAEIDRRLAQLDAEWDIERYLETMAPTITLLGLALGITKSRKWLILPVIVQSFFLQHALQGWCPPLPLLRRLGVRTTDEIQQERYALKTLRGDFHDVSPVSADSADGRVADALAAVRS